MGMTREEWMCWLRVQNEAKRMPGEAYRSPGRRKSRGCRLSLSVARFALTCTCRTKGSPHQMMPIHVWANGSSRGNCTCCTCGQIVRRKLAIHMRR